jgi:transcriptional regulator with XRE-family HTH domain
MRLEDLTTTDAVVAELGRRFERARLQRNLTQAELAEAAGVGEATLRRFERGRSIQLTTLVKLFEAMRLLGGLETILPEDSVDPIAEVERWRGRRRASGARIRRGRQQPRTPWRWGDEREDRT